MRNGVVLGENREDNMLSKYNYKQKKDDWPSITTCQLHKKLRVKETQKEGEQEEVKNKLTLSCMKWIQKILR